MLVRNRKRKGLRNFILIQYMYVTETGGIQAFNIFEIGNYS